MKKSYRSEIAFSESRVVGSYTFSDLFQIRPIPKESPALEFTIGHHPFLLEYAYDLPEIQETSYNPELPDWHLSHTIEREASGKVRKWILLVLSVFLKSRIFQYTAQSNEQCWFLALPRGSQDSSFPTVPQWGYPGYHHGGIQAWVIDSLPPVEEPAISLVETNKYYQTETPLQYVVGRTPTEFELPDQIDAFLQAFLALPEYERAVFLSSCFLFSKAIELFWNAPSLAFAASVSSLEALIVADHKGETVDRCDLCGQERFAVRQKFLQFIEKYGSDSPKWRKFADKVYQRRSKILHGGQLIVGEVDPRTIEGAIEWLADNDSLRGVIMFFRACIINWLLTRSLQAKKAL